MKKIMLMGRTGSGKTSLTQRINEQEYVYKKTQALEFWGSVIDTPGEYIENKNYYSALIVSSCESDVICLIQDVNDEESIFPPGFALMFNKPVIGIISKIDLNSKSERAKEYLINAGAQEIFSISSQENLGFDELRSFLKE